VPIHLVTVEGGAAPVEPAAAPSAGAALRMGRTTSSAHLRRRLVFRVSDRELGDYDDWRWTENPEEYLRRSVERALFTEHGLSRVIAGEAPTLDVELVAFEEVRHGERRAGRVDVVYWLRGNRTVIAHGEATSEKAARSAAPEDVVAAIAEALEDVTEQVSIAVVARLPEGRP
jgi:cholesterol transport system auxiliary component